MKRLIFLLLFLALFCVGQALGATYYVRVAGVGSNTSPYDTPAKGANIVKTLVDYLRVNGSGVGDIIDIGPGTFSNANDLIVLDETTLDNLTIQGAGRSLTILTPTAYHAIYGDNDISNLTVKDLTLQQNGAAVNIVYKTADAGVWNFTNVDFKSGPSHAETGLKLYGDETNLTRCRVFFNYTASKYPIYYFGDSSGTVQYCQFFASGTSKIGNSVALVGSGTQNFVNNIVMDVAEHAIIANTGTSNISNNIIAGSTVSHTQYVINKAGGTVNSTNNILISSPWNDDYWNPALDTDTGNIKTNANPYFISYGRGGFLVPTVDDAGGLGTGYVEAIETLLAAKGFKGTWYTNISNLLDTLYDDARALMSRGVFEIGLHGYSHTNLTYANALLFSQTGGSNCTVAFDNTTITLNCDGTDYDNTLDTTNAAYDTIVEIVSALNGVKGWTVAKSTTGSQTASSISDSALATSLATLLATPEPCDITFNRAGIGEGLFKDEIADAKDFLEDSIINVLGNLTDPQTGATYSVNTYGATYNAGDAATKAAAYATFQAYRYNTGAIGASVQNLKDVDIFALGSADYTHVVGDGSEAAVRRNTRALAFAIVQSGLIVPFYAHNTTEFSIAQWTWFLDELSKFNQLTVTSMQAAVAAIKAGWTDDLDGTYRKIYTTFTDFNIRAGSPAIDAGTAVTGLHTGSTIVGGDAGGNTRLYGSGVDIGGYEKLQKTASLFPVLPVFGKPKYYTVP